MWTSMTTAAPPHTELRRGRWLLLGSRMDWTPFPAAPLRRHTLTRLLVIRLSSSGMSCRLNSAPASQRQVAELVVDNLELVARYTAKPTGDTTTIRVATTQPERGFTVALAPDTV